MGWRFWIDRGGTFTDVVARDPQGGVHTRKLLSSDPQRYADAAVAGIRHLLDLPPHHPVPAGLIEEVRLGTTVATNALLERRGARTALVITHGFTDALRIGYQNRPDIFARRIERAEPPVEQVIAVDERMGADGTPHRRPDLGALRRQLLAARADGIESVAVVGLHAALHPAHERAAAELAREIGFTDVVASAEASPLRKLVPRGDTAVLDAYLSPGLRHYVDAVRAELPGVRLLFMCSTGGLTDSALVRGKDAVLSGPAGGIVGMVRSAATAGYTEVIGFDMGGTSTDVSHYAGEFERLTEAEVAGIRLQVPMLDIHTVAAGGGSVLTVVDGRFRVGPESAGARPGPACYRHGGPLTITDANLVLGRIAAAHFPAVFGPQADQPLDCEVARAGFRAVADRLGVGQADEVAAGFLAVAVDNMANAVRRITVAKGRDLAGHALVSFGGAGGQHACAVAEALDISTVLIPPMSGLLSAVGIGQADLTARRVQAVERRLDDLSPEDLARLSDDLGNQAEHELRTHGAAATAVHRRSQVHLRYDGTETTEAVPLGSAAQMQAAFAQRHERTYSFRLRRPLVVASVSVEAVSAQALSAVSMEAVAGNPPPGGGDSSSRVTVTGDRADPGHDPDQDPAPADQTRIYSAGQWRQCPLFRRDQLPATAAVRGPALVVEDGATTVVEDGWTARPARTGHLVLSRDHRRRDPRATPTATRNDPVRLEIFANLFAAIAEQMGARLRATAQSVNIAERLDFSCAVFDAAGHLIANAPHMPVHLGSMGASVAAVLHRHGPRIRAGDSYVVNDPFRGGTHLPDVTVVTPVFATDLGPAPLPHIPDRPLFFVASRGHHAEIGGISPGSMPANSRTLEEEGVCFQSDLLVRNGEFREESIRQILGTGAYPSRNPDLNIADLRAQVAANAKGVAELARAVHRHGLEVITAFMAHVQDNAADAVRRVIDRLADGSCRYEMDCGAVIAVTVRVQRRDRTATLDFTGTSEQRADNLNAPSSVVTAAALYVFRTLVGEQIPLNDGCLRPLQLIVPAGSLLAPQPPAAVVAGNVETSQAVTGALYAAMGVAAEGSGTMNNVSFGNAHSQYYETVASGSGAGPDYDGAAVVQTHMTNSRLTDPEVLESRFPVVVEEFAIRRGSGGRGRHRGGDGAVRRLRFTEPVAVSLLSSHRRIPPYGMAGGMPGALGENVVEGADGSIRPLAGCDQFDAVPGDILTIRTPGGGGYGSPSSTSAGDGDDSGEADHATLG